MFTQEQIATIKYWLECQKWAIPKHNPAIYNFNIQKRENYSIDAVIKALESDKTGINGIVEQNPLNRKIRRKRVPDYLQPEKMMKRMDKERAKIIAEAKEKEIEEKERQRSKELKEELKALKEQIKKENCAFCGLKAEGDFKCQCGAKLCEDCSDDYCKECCDKIKEKNDLFSSKKSDLFSS